MSQRDMRILIRQIIQEELCIGPLKTFVDRLEKRILDAINF